MSLLLSALLLAPAQPMAPSSFREIDAVVEDTGWTATGELGFAMARGNSRSESLNTKLALTRENEHRLHRLRGAALRTRSDVTGDFDGDGTPESRYEITANRFDLGASTAWKFNERNYIVGAGRYENDDFSPYEYQGTASIGYGHYFLRNERTTLLTEIGPGYRRAREFDTGEVQSGALLRGLVDYRIRLTDTTSLVNTLLVEAGDENTYAQNDFGISVAMTEVLALKAGLEVRHNTDVPDATTRNTDTLTTINLVYTFR
ncbi:DUF481 domain-containing protein [Luteimonas abyssi]|jgi:putative salt-induced outer membrane protein|uniref:DUF481 domain-containing protein n=1 Tax=Luteimonas abyssi TaxID=1247514 RepID=UPI000737D6A0|nr:DUF481 domain-containing protein [Luteimonas abyssi]